MKRMNDSDAHNEIVARFGEGCESRASRRLADELALYSAGEGCAIMLRALTVKLSDGCLWSYVATVNAEGGLDSIVDVTPGKVK